MLADAEDAAVRDQLITSWTRSQSGPELVEKLQNGGIAAGLVQDIEDLLEHDPQIAARAALVTLEHPLLGPLWPRAHAPGFLARHSRPLSSSRNR